MFSLSYNSAIPEEEKFELAELLARNKLLKKMNLFDVFLCLRLGQYHVTLDVWSCIISFVLRLLK
jgi:hypothetical protein